MWHTVQQLPNVPNMSFVKTLYIYVCMPVYEFCIRTQTDKSVYIALDGLYKE